MSYFKNKVVVVTGSSLGIGKNLAHQLLELGAQVVLNGRNAQRLNKVSEEFRQQGHDPLAVVGDVSHVEDCRRLMASTVKRFGQLDILINNAGISMEGELDQTDPEVFRKVIDVNLLGVVNATKAALPHLKRSRGSLLLISSVAAIAGLPRFSAYSASKMALTSLAQSLRTELTGSGIHVGIAYLGFTENDPEKQILNYRGHPVPQPPRKLFRAEPVDRVVREILVMLRCRRHCQVFSPLGKLAAVLNRISPSFYLWLVRRKFLKHFPRQKNPSQHGDSMEKSHLHVAR